MARYAVGDLLIDLDLPDGFKAEYTLSGSLLATAEDGVIEISGLTAREKDGSPATFTGRRERRDETTFCFGSGQHLLIATHPPHLASATERILESAGPSHEPFDDDDDALQVRPLGASLEPWLRQRRRSLQVAIGFDPTAPDAPAKLDDFWEALFVKPPREDELDTMIACAWVAFGDLLQHRLGFRWCISRDEWGTDLGCVALPDTAKLLIVPSSFVGKRWERRERRFVEDALPAIARNVRDAASQS